MPDQIVISFPSIVIPITIAIILCGFCSWGMASFLGTECHLDHKNDRVHNLDLFLAKGNKTKKWIRSLVALTMVIFATPIFTVGCLCAFVYVIAFGIAKGASWINDAMGV